MGRLASSASASYLPCDLRQVSFHFSPSVFPSAKWDQQCLTPTAVGCHGDKGKVVGESIWKRWKLVGDVCSVTVSTSWRWDGSSVRRCRIEHPSWSRDSDQARRAQRLFLQWTSAVPCLIALPSLFSVVLISLRCTQAQTHSLGEARKNRAVYLSAQMTGKSFYPASLETVSDQILGNPKA